MTAETGQDFTTYQGDDVFPVFTVRDSAGTPIDISNVSQITWRAIKADASSSSLILSKTGGAITFVTNGTDGKFQVAISAANTAALDGYYFHQASIADFNNMTTTVAVGRFRVGVKPLWTYDQSSLATNRTYQVRRLIGDVIEQDQQLMDEEINFCLTTCADIWSAGAEAARSIAGQYSRKVDTTSPGELRTAYSAQAANYLRLALRLDARSQAVGAGVDPYAGGISVADKETYQQDSDRVTPQFNIYMNDNFIPVAVGGNEIRNSTPTSQTDNG